MIERIYRWVLGLAGRKDAEMALGAVSFAESSFFPIPPDLMLIPMVIARPDRAWRIATICTVGSVLGGILGYFIGAVLYDTVGHWLIGIYGLQQKADGYVATIVNGEITYRDGQPTGALPGRLVRGDGYTPARRAAA